jgi:hypothetical protein
VLLALVAAMTRREEVCALVDVNDSFDPHSAEAAGVDLRRLLWVRCSKNRVIGRSGDRVTKDGKNDQWPGGSGRRKPQITNPSMSLLDQALKATDLLLQGGGFGLVVVDLGDVSPQAARRIPLTSWFRFRRAVERTPTVLLVVEQEPYAKTCASAVLRLVGRLQPSGARLQQGQEPSHARLFSALEITAEVVRSAAQGKKPVRAEGASFASRALWTG